VSAGATPAIDIVRRAGVDHRIHEYDLPERHGKDRDARPAYGLEAADVLGVAPDRMFKTLVTSVDDRLVISVRWAPGGPCRSSPTLRCWSTKRCSCRPAGVDSSSSWHHPTWCV